MSQQLALVRNFFFGAWSAKLSAVTWFATSPTWRVSSCSNKSYFTMFLTSFRTTLFWYGIEAPRPPRILNSRSCLSCCLAQPQATTTSTIGGVRQYVNHHNEYVPFLLYTYKI